MPRNTSWNTATVVFSRTEHVVKLRLILLFRNEGIERVGAEINSAFQIASK